MVQRGKIQDYVDKAEKNVTIAKEQVKKQQQWVKKLAPDGNASEAAMLQLLEFQQLEKAFERSRDIMREALNRSE